MLKIDFSPMQLKTATPKVGMGVVIRKFHGIFNITFEILLGLRKNSHGAGEWSLPGGHLELGESCLGCARREVKEEVGLDVKTIIPIGFTNNVFEKEGLHYITLLVEADSWVGEPKIMEPDKFEKIEWFTDNNLPENIFFPLKKLFTCGYKVQNLYPPMGGYIGDLDIV